MHAQPAPSFTNVAKLKVKELKAKGYQVVSLSGKVTLKSPTSSYITVDPFGRVEREH